MVLKGCWGGKCCGISVCLRLGCVVWCGGIVVAESGGSLGGLVVGFKRGSGLGYAFD